MNTTSKTLSHGSSETSPPGTSTVSTGGHPAHWRKFADQLGFNPNVLGHQDVEQAGDFAQSTIDALSSHVCILSEKGTIIAVNRAWKNFAQANRTIHSKEIKMHPRVFNRFWEGSNYLAICDRAAADGVENGADEAREFAKGIRAVLRGERENYSLEYPCHSSNEQRWFIGSVTRFSENRLPRILVEHIDVTERKLAEKVLQRSEENLRELTENIREVFWMMNATGTEVLYVSPAYEYIWGLSAESLYKTPGSWKLSIHNEDRTHAAETFERQLRGETIENQYRIVQPSGAIRWILCRAFSVRDSAGNVIRVGGIAEDITERKLVELRLLYQANYDELTGLPNRRLFGEKLDQALAESKTFTTHGAVFFIDLDNFKLVNDTLGHAVGDQLLKEAADRLRAECHQSATLARFGGDEFTMVAPGVEGQESAREIGNKLIKCLKEPFKIAERDLFVSASIGISIFPEDGMDPSSLKRDANIAMHQAKHAGKNQLTFFLSSYSEEVRKTLDLDTRLRKAIIQSEFKLQFQPQFALGRSPPRRFEALVRWHPPKSQPIPPLEFIPLAEQNGLIIPIGTWVLRDACRQCADWQTGALRGAGVAVNVSGLQFASPNFVDTVVNTLELTGLSPSLLELEITESVVIRDVTVSALTLTKLRDLGVTIALDDFGTGYSSLSYLKDLPIDALKIDRSFLAENDNGVQGPAVLRCVVQLAQALGLRVIAEGVETPTQLALLSSLGCDEFQGFLLGRPSFDVSVSNDREGLQPLPAAGRDGSS